MTDRTQPAATPIELPLLAAIATVSTALFVLFPIPGYRGWDGWMTASSLASWHDTPWTAIFYFAHPLLIAITRLFSLALPFQDQLFVVMVRECLMAGINTALVYLFVRALLRDRAASLLVAAAFLFAHGNWSGATMSEEKNTMLVVSMLAALPYAHLRGWIRLVPLDRVPRLGLAAIVGAGMALAFCVHLQNGLLVPWVLITCVARRDFFRELRGGIIELAVIFGVAGALVAAFILPVAWFIQGVRDLHGLSGWLFEYHTSGQFVDTGQASVGRLVRGWTDFRGYVFGPGRLKGGDGAQCAVAIVFAIAVVARAISLYRAVAVALLVFVGLVTANFFNMQPTIDDWGGAGVAGITLLALGTFGPIGSRGRRQLYAAWGALTIALIAADWSTYRSRLKEYRPLKERTAAVQPARYGWLERRFQAGVPGAQVAFVLDGAMETDAIVLVRPRLLASALLVYTGRKATCSSYLNRDEEYFRRPDVALTVLSRHFYVPPLDSATLLSEAQRGRPVYHISASDIDEDRLSRLVPGDWRVVRNLEFDELKLYRWAPAP